MNTNVELRNNTIDSARILTEAIFGIILTFIGIIVTIALSVWTYNHRYDANAIAADAFVMTFQSNSNVAAATIKASAGTIYYGYFQKSGSCPTKYQMYYKKTSSSSYTTLKSFTIYQNNDPEGDFRMLYSRYSGSYDIKVQRTSNKSVTTKLEVDWCIA